MFPNLLEYGSCIWYYYILRAVILIITSNLGELDTDLLTLTSELLQKSPNIYTLWNIRWQVIDKKIEVFYDYAFSRSILNICCLGNQCCQRKWNSKKRTRKNLWRRIASNSGMPNVRTKVLLSSKQYDIRYHLCLINFSI